jgi:hypothetical protein
MTEQDSMAIVATAPKTNPLSIAALALATVALVGMVVLGAVAIAIFTVGAGHLALQQISKRGERGRTLAVVSLLIGYGIGLYVILDSIYFWISFALRSH